MFGVAACTLNLILFNYTCIADKFKPKHMHFGTEIQQ